MGVMASQITSLTIVSQPFIQAQIKKNIKALRHWPLSVTGEFPAQMASNAENVSIWWRHHVNSDITHIIPCFGHFAKYVTGMSGGWQL